MMTPAQTLLARECVARIVAAKRLLRRLGIVPDEIRLPMDEAQCLALAALGGGDPDIAAELDLGPFRDPEQPAASTTPAP